MHAFNIVGNDGSRHVARFTFEPVEGVRDADKSADSAPHGAYGHLGPHYLTEELGRRLEWFKHEGHISLRFTLRMTLADPWDDPDDPTVVWPTNRRQVIMGTLDIDGQYAESWSEEYTYTGEKLSFNPGRLPLDHMDPTDDELLRARIQVYNLSQERRGSTYCPVIHGDFPPDDVGTGESPPDEVGSGIVVEAD